MMKTAKNYHELFLPASKDDREQKGIHRPYMGHKFDFMMFGAD